MKKILNIILVVSLFWSYGYFCKQLNQSSYPIFDFKKIISWVETDKGIYRTATKGDIDNLLLSREQWRDYTVSFSLVNPKQASLLFQYEDNAHFYYLWFDSATNTIAFTRKAGTYPENLVSVAFPFSVEQRFILKVQNDSAVLMYKNQPLMRIALPSGFGRVGLVLPEAGFPRAIFHNIHIEGRIADGQMITAHSPPSIPSSFWDYLRSFLPFYVMLIVVSLGAAFQLRRYNLYKGQSADRESAGMEKGISIKWVIGIHLLLAATLFWPFLRQGYVLIASSDNFGEILPLFFYSKHIFNRLVQEHSLSLWNPYVHNGIPFFSNHWNMIYSPLNWPIFLLPDQQALWALTLKTLVEVFLIGLCAYGFFRLELGDSKWALFCSITYQLCSLLIFTITIFPTIDLYFASTLYLYLLWSVRQRSIVSNYVLLTLAVILALVTANVVFTFYTVLSLGVISIYRLASLKIDRGRTGRVLLLSVLTGFLISSIRLVPCLEGIMNSNRITENYYTLHDRIFLLLRFFIPELTGWFDQGSIQVLADPNLNLFFQEMNLPWNSQNTFFVYFGTIAAILLVIGFLIRLPGPGRFWQIYTMVALAIALLIQPFWGILNILFFPVIHFSYHLLILPAGICALAGHVGIHLERSDVQLKSFSKKFFITVLLLGSYLLVFVTYLLPQLTSYSRFVLLFLAGGAFLKFFLPRMSSSWQRWFAGKAITMWHVFLSVVFLVFAVVLLLKPTPHKEDLAGKAIIPFLAFCYITFTTINIYKFLLDEPSVRPSLWKVIYGGILTCVIPLLAGAIVSPLLSQWVKFDGPVRIYLQDFFLALLRVFFMAYIVIAGGILLKRGVVPRRWFMNLVIILAAAELLVFNLRFDNIATPHYHKNVFFDTALPYFDINEQLKKTLDLTNFRADGFENTTLDGNRNLIFSVPSYSGIVGYMPKRFAKFIHNFGFPEKTIFIYPVDSTRNDRFLDLSAVRYVLQRDQTVQERPSALSRLNLFYGHEVIAGEKELLARLKHESFDPHRKVLLEVDPLVPSEGNDRNYLPLMLQQIDHDHVVSDVTADSPGIILFNESFDQGWKAIVDGKRVPVFRANYNFIACLVEPGKHVVEFIYRPESYFRALYLSLAGIILFVLLSCWNFYRGRK